LVEAVNASDEEYGEAELRLLLENAGVPVLRNADRLMAGLDLFVGNTPQHDDVTCMLLKA